MVCRSAFSRLPTAQSEIEARHRCLQLATSRYESYGFQYEGGKPVRFAGRLLADCRRLNRRLRRGTAAAETLLKVEIPMWDFKSALPTADGKIKDFAAAPQGLRCVPSGGAKRTTSRKRKSRNPCLPLMRKVAKPQVLTEGENFVSFDALNLWASKREFEIS